MRRPALLVWATVLFVLLLAGTALAVGPGSGFYDNYQTSSLCQSCHPVIHSSWASSPHGTPVTYAIDRGGNCRSCHVTNFDPETGEYSEPGAGCEACHGPITIAHSGSTIVGTGVGPDWQSNAQICGQCHNRHAVSTLFPNIEYAVGYQPDKDLEEFATSPAPVGFPGNPEGFRPGEFWKDYPSWHNYSHGGGGQQYQEWRQSGHAMAGVACQTCHTPHEAAIDAQDDPDVPGVRGHAMLRALPLSLCGQCHTGTGLTINETPANPQLSMLRGTGGIGAPQVAHVHSAYCIQCHMVPTGYTHSGDPGLGGNHLWKIVMPAVAASLETEIQVGGETVVANMPFSSCSECHSTSGDPLATRLQPVIDGRQNQITARVAALETRLNELAGQTGDNLRVWREARYNIEFVKADGSQGFHNYQYAAQLLDVAQNRLDQLTGVGGFTDLQPGQLYFDEVSFLAARGIVSGYVDGRFGPYDFVLRAQFAKMAVLTLDIHTEAIENINNPTFPDVPYAGVDYPFDFVEEAVAAGIIQGFPDGTFRPFQPITRVQMALMVVRAGGAALAAPPAGYQTGFTDLVGLSAEAQAAIATAKFHGIIDGKTATTFAPWETANRGQAAKMLYNLYQILN
jgi:hypothetical protein